MWQHLTTLMSLWLQGWTNCYFPRDCRLLVWCHFVIFLCKGEKLLYYLVNCCDCDSLNNNLLWFVISVVPNRHFCTSCLLFSFIETKLNEKKHLIIIVQYVLYLSVISFRKVLPRQHLTSTVWCMYYTSLVDGKHGNQEWIMMWEKVAVEFGWGIDPVPVLVEALQSAGPSAVARVSMSGTAAAGGCVVSSRQSTHRQLFFQSRQLPWTYINVWRFTRTF